MHAVVVVVAPVLASVVPFGLAALLYVDQSWKRKMRFLVTQLETAVAQYQDNDIDRAAFMAVYNEVAAEHVDEEAA